MKKLLALTTALSFVLVGCVSEDESVAPTPVDNTFKASYNPAGGIFPFPNDLFFNGSADGTLNMPVVSVSDVSDFNNAMNALDGYSVNAPIFVPFSRDIDPATVSNADVLFVDLGVTASPASAPAGPTIPLTAGTHYSVAVSSASDGGSQLVITPLVPLQPKHRYAVVVSRTISAMNGDVVVADDTFQALLDIHTAGVAPPAELAAIYGAVSPLFAVSNGFGITNANNAVTFSFLTQSTTDVMTLVNTQAVAGAVPALTPIGTTATLIGAASPGYANVFQGVITVPYYQSSTDPMTGHWQTASGGEVTRYTVLGGAGPAATGTLTVPVLISVPNATSPAFGAGKPGAGWPIMIFQHGITGNRTNMLGIADAAAAAGFAVIAIDQPLHGLGTTHPLRVAGMERTFDLDVSNNTTGAPGADGVVDASGQNYINLSSLLTSRDNLRQSAADLIRVAKTVPAIDIDGGGTPDLDVSRMHFTGHSLGAIVGTVMLGVNTNVLAASLGMPGGGIARLLRDSATFAPRINAGLAGNGVVAGTQLYERFMQAAQTVVDQGDPINFAAAANANHSIHLIQVIGGATLPDQVVPNSATARLIAAMGLTKRTATGAGDGYVNFIAGDHSSLLLPTASAAAFSEMQSEVAAFMATNGGNIVLTNTAVIDTTP